MIVRWTALVLAFTATFLGLCATVPSAHAGRSPRSAQPSDLDGATIFSWNYKSGNLCVSALANMDPVSPKPTILNFLWNPQQQKWVNDARTCPTPLKHASLKDKAAVCEKFTDSKTLLLYCSAPTQASIKSIDAADIAAISGGVGNALTHDPKFRVAHLDPDELNEIKALGDRDWLLMDGGITIVAALLGLVALALYSQYKSRRLHDQTDRLVHEGIAVLSLKLDELPRRPADPPMPDSSSSTLAAVEQFQSRISTELQAHISAELKDGIGRVTALFNDSLTPAMLSSLAQVPSLIEVLRGMAQPRIVEDFGSSGVLDGGQAQHVDILVAALAQRLQAHFQTMVEELVRESRGAPSESAILATLSVQSERMGEIASRLGELENKIEKGLASAGSNTAAAQESLLPVAATQDLDQAFRGLAEGLAAARIENVLPEAGLRAAHDTTTRIPLATQQALATLGLDPSIWEPAVRFLRAMNLEALDERRLAALRPALDAFLKLALGPAVEAFVPAAGERINSELHADVTGSSSFGSTNIASVQSAGVTWRGRVVLRSFVKHRVG